MKIIWTEHAEERQREWEKKRSISRAEVETLLAKPEQIVTGDRGVLVAQARRRGGLIRAPFVDVGNDRKVLTVYWTSRVARYWKEERDENQV
ncbi:MAG: DUF4258 domain-containing protein [Acidobacteria bacterium]|nr:DUF4258 domain-containing protein [Acidobacteriota bacterium]